MNSKERAIYNRTRLLVGDWIMERLEGTSVIIFGIGGVGSWCAEGLLRSGIKNITIVDSDRVCITNVNRQLMATLKTIGKVKTDALKERLLEINPAASITSIQEIYSQETADSFDLDSYDYVIDAIDSLKDKMTLLLNASRSKATLFSSMGAACKVDPTKVQVAEFWKVRGCPLGAAIRKKMRQKGVKPSKKFYCVFDDEVLPNLGTECQTCGTDACMCPKATAGPGREDLLNHEWCTKKAVINGTTAPVTAIFGMTLAGLVLKDVYRKARLNA